MKEFDRIYAKFINHMLLYGYRPRLLKISIDKYFEFDIPTIQLLDKISSCYNKLNDKQYECFWSSIISLIDIPDRSLTKFANDNEIKIKHSLNGCLTNFNIGNLLSKEFFK